MGRHSPGDDGAPGDDQGRTMTVVDEPSSADQTAGVVHRHHRLLWAAITVFWVLGLVAGFVCTLGVAARFGCDAGATGLACKNTGSALGLALVVAIVITVGVSTVFAFEARDRTRSWATCLGIGIVVMAVVVVAARLLSSTL